MIMQDLEKNGGLFDTLETEVDAICGCSLQLGIVVGFEDAAKALFAKSGESFKKGDDDRARLTRELAREVMQIAEDRRKVLKSNREAWDSLKNLVTSVETEFTQLADAMGDYQNEIDRLKSQLEGVVKASPF